jgi:uncharacterized metal-binding protein YceD (DUF177 family)
MTAGTAPEFSRCYQISQIGGAVRDVAISADSGERQALAKRFDLVMINRLESEARLVADGEAILCNGTLHAEVEQRCAATGIPVAARISSDFAIRFVAQGDEALLADEIEIDVDDCDIIEHDGQTIDLGEAAAQTLLLALDPFPRAPGAAEILKTAGVVGEDEVSTGAFAGLKDLFKKN